MNYSYNYNSGNGSDMDFMIAFMGIYLIAILISFGILLVHWLIEAFAMYRLAKRADEPNAWMAFVPFAHAYQKVALPSFREFDILGIIRTRERGTVALFYVFAPIIIAVASMIPILGYIVAFVGPIALLFVKWRINYDLFMTFGDQDKANIFAIIGVFIPLVSLIYLLIISFGDTYNDERAYRYEGRNW